MSDQGQNQLAQQLQPKKTWAELHSEWDEEPPKNPGKILLLYSPDSKVKYQRETHGLNRGFVVLQSYLLVDTRSHSELMSIIASDKT